MNAKHTPGPWIAGDDEDSDLFLVGPASFDDVVTHPVVSLHSEANALLIAAAPELLEAGKALVEALDRDYLVNDDQRQGFDLLLAAIAKAEGK